MFEQLGVGAADLAVYREMLADPDMTVADLAARIDASAAEVRETLDSLERHGFVRRSHADPDRLRPEPPQLAFERLLGDQETELHRAQERLSAWRAKAAELVDDLSRASPGASYGEFERLVGTDEIIARMRELERSATVSIDSMVPTLMSEHVLGQAKVDDGATLERGVAIRAIYPAVARQDDVMVGFARWFREHGGLVRTAVDVPNRVAVLDREVAVLTWDPRHPFQGAVVLNSPGVVIALQAYFDVLWDTSEDLGPDTKEDEDLKPEERDLLRLLARGDKDEAIARSLGVSIRTVGRMVNALGAQVGATSRFELGVHAVRQGWLNG